MGKHQYMHLRADVHMISNKTLMHNGRNHYF